jgi:hypothetical protein
MRRWAQTLWLGARLGLARLAGPYPSPLRGLALPSGLLVGAVALGLLQRQAEVEAPVDAALQSLRAWWVPAVAVSVVSRILGPVRLGEGVALAAETGLSRRALVLGLGALGLVVSVVLGGAGAGLAVLVSSPAVSGATAADAGLSAWIGALGAQAYLGVSLWGASWGRRGWGRYLPWLLELARGPGLALLLPGAHLGRLWGEPGELGLSATGSFLLLAASGPAWVALASLRLRR